MAGGLTYSSGWGNGKLRARRPWVRPRVRTRALPGGVNDGSGADMNLGNDLTEIRSASRSGRVSRILAVVLATPLVLGGCSEVPDWADATDWFAEDEAPTKVGLSQDQAGYQQSASFPNLASVPDSPPKVTPSITRAQIQDGLTADRANAEYSGERLTGETTSPSRSLGTARSAPLAVAGAPPAPKIAADLVGQEEASPAPSPARPQVAQTQAVQPVAPAPVGQTQLRSPQLQGAAGAAPTSVVAGAQLVAVIYFGDSSAQLDANDHGVLNGVAALHRQRGGLIRVIGHASAHTGVVNEINHHMANFEISLKRANAIAAGIVALGVAKDQVRAEARGDSQPVYHESMPNGEAGNRRAEIFLEY